MIFNILKQNLEESNFNNKVLFVNLFVKISNKHYKIQFSNLIFNLRINRLQHEQQNDILFLPQLLT